MEEIKKRFDEYFKGNIDENSYLHINTVYVRYFIQSEIDLAVSKERETFMDTINQLKLVHSMELDSVSCKSLEEFVKWATNRKDLINTK